MAETVLNITFLSGLIFLSLRLTTPILLASTANLIPSLAGVVDMSTEGSMTMGAFFAFLITHHTGSLWLGVLVGALTGLVFSLLSVLMIVVLKIRHSVSGIALNLLASGVTFFLFRTFYSSTAEHIPHINVFNQVNIPWLSGIPILGVLFSQHALTYFTYFVVLLLWLFIYKTKYGLILRATGEERSGCGHERVQCEPRPIPGTDHGRWSLWNCWSFPPLGIDGDLCHQYCSGSRMDRGHPGGLWPIQTRSDCPGCPFLWILNRLTASNPGAGHPISI